VSEVVLLLAYIGAMVIRGDAFVRHSVQDSSHFMNFYAHCGCFCFIRQVQGVGAESEPWRNAQMAPFSSDTMAPPPIPTCCIAAMKASQPAISLQLQRSTCASDLGFSEFCLLVSGQCLAVPHMLVPGQVDA